MPNTQTTSSPDSPLTTDLLCAKCLYNLRTKKPSELCPECAHPVADSIAFRRSSPFTRPILAELSTLLFALSAGFTAATFVVSSEMIAQPMMSRGLYYVRYFLQLLSSLHFIAAVTLTAAALLLLAARSRPTSIPIRICRFIVCAIAILYFLVDLRLAYLYFGDDPMHLTEGHTPETLLVATHHLCHACLLLAGWLYLRTLSRRFHRPALFIAVSLLLLVAMPWELNRSVQLLHAYARVSGPVNWLDILHNFNAALQWPHFIAHLLLIPACLILAFTFRRKFPLQHERGFPIAQGKGLY